MALTSSHRNPPEENASCSMPRGQYVEFPAQAAANSIVVRYCLPDTTNGLGMDSTISLYTNGAFAQELPVTSKYSWLYGAYPWANDPSAGAPRNFYDEVRLKGLSINPGDLVRLQKGSNDTAFYYVIDLVDLENVAPPRSAPGEFAVHYHVWRCRRWCDGRHSRAHRLHCSRQFPRRKRLDAAGNLRDCRRDQYSV